MTAPLDQLDRLMGMPMDAILGESVERHESDIVELNLQQLDRGLDSTGKSLGQYASVKYKNRLQPVDLLDTGAFRGSFGVDTQTGGFVMNSTDSKTGFLTTRYGPDIHGVPEADKPEVGAWLADDLTNEIRDEL